MLEEKEMAKSVLCNMFNIRESDIVFMKSRKYNINEARIYFIYFLFWHKGVKHYHMKNHVFGIHHATSIYHVKKMREMLMNYSDVRERFLYFIYQADIREWENMKFDNIYSIDELYKPIKNLKNED